MYSIYKVQIGDTLASVANKVGISIDELSKINGIMMGTSLNPGDNIIVPNRTDENMYFTKYRVNNGDTIYGIARRYGIDPKNLLRLNGLNENDVIYQGDLIFVPKNGVSFYITGMDETLGDVVNKMGVTPGDLANQNGTIYLTNDQLIVYKK